MEITVVLSEEQHTLLVKLLVAKVKELTKYNAACPQYARLEEMEAMEALLEAVSVAKR